MGIDDDDFSFDYEDNDDEPDREDGRNPGQGWWLEKQTRDAILDLNHIDVDEIELNVTIATLEVDIAIKTPIDKRWVVECKDWQEGTLSPHDVFRLAAVANRANAIPILVHIEETEITDRAELLCKELNIPRLTLSELQDREVRLPTENHQVAEDRMHTPDHMKWSDLPEIYQFPKGRKTKKRDEKAHYVSRKRGPV